VDGELLIGTFYMYIIQPSPYTIQPLSTYSYHNNLYLCTFKLLVPMI